MGKCTREIGSVAKIEKVLLVGYLQNSKHVINRLMDGMEEKMEGCDTFFRVLR